MSSSKQGIAPVQKGDVLDDKYRVEKILGVGGMGVIVAARHVELDTFVALKFMLPEALTDPESVQRFSREARAMVRLKNVHSARVFDVGKLHSGAPYMVMELLVGQDLGELLEKSGVPLPIPEAIDYVLQACEGISEAHALGIIHRDIKPRNIFLTRAPDGKTLVKVLDFGLAKSVAAEGAAERALTRTSAIMGSPTYMSPEQMRASRDIDARTDIWSLGVCLYELLIHTPPFDAPTIPELCSLVLTAAPQPPMALRPDIPPGLSDAIMRCLEKDPAKRFPDIRTLAQALAPFARWTAEPVVRPSAGRTIATVIGVLLLLSAVTGTWLFVRTGRRAPTPSAAASSATAPPALRTVDSPPEPALTTAEVAPPPPPTASQTAQTSSGRPHPIVRPAPTPQVAKTAFKPDAGAAPAPPITTAF